MRQPLRPGSVQPRPPRNRSQAYAGIQPLSDFHQSQRFEPLPRPLGLPPYHYDLATPLPGIEQTAQQLGHLTFHVVGDTGGIKDAKYQDDVAALMKQDLFKPLAERPSFFYHLGDVVYFNGEHKEYYPQFYEPYNHYDAPILSIPGNHDGAPLAGDTSLSGWVAYFMTPAPHIDPISQDAPRVTLALPNVYYTLNCPFVTLVGLYTNVPEGGSVDSVQQQWLTHEFANAPDTKALLVCLHHPIYSFDDHHSGSPRMADLIQNAINDSKRIPNLVLTAHVHNYQRIEKNIAGKEPTPFLVAGHGGYYHLHHLNAEDGAVDNNTGAGLIKSNDRRHGYLTLQVDAHTVRGTVALVADSGQPAEPAFDQFSYPAGPLHLPDNVTVTL